MKCLDHIIYKALLFPVGIFWMELVFKWWTLGEPFGTGVLYTALFSGAIGLLFAFLAGLGRERTHKAVVLGLMGITTLWFWGNAVYYTIFKTFPALDSLTMAGEAVGSYWRETFTGIVNTWPALFLLAVPFAASLLAEMATKGRRSAETAMTARGKILLLCAAIVVQGLAVAAVNSAKGGVAAPNALYRGEVIPELSVSNFGLLTTLRLDIRNRLFGLLEEGVEQSEISKLPETSESSGEPEQSGVEVPAEDETAPDPQPVIYQDNVLNIDFAALAESAPNSAIKAIDQWVASRTPTKQNEYTGMFAGKNLIFITAEAFWKYAVDEELTPTLYKLANEGFVFENFYNPLWWRSTIDGEYVACTGLIPSNQVFSFRTSGSNSMPFCMGNMLRAEGYATTAYHNNTYTYYDRDISHPNMGYDYYGVGNGLEVANTWPQSDLEMMEQTIPQALASGQPFHNYYMTVSGHMNYSFVGNMMSYRHRDEVAHLEMGEEARAYLACNIEFDRAMEYVLRQLEQAEQLENTVICISGDHYPYGMDPATWDELSGMEMDTDFEIFRSTLILWSGDMKEPIHIEKPACSMDVLPTLLNLFGLEYDSRLLAGQDILSDAPGLVVLSNRSFITELGTYKSSGDKWTPNEGVTVPEGYVSDTYKQVSALFKHCGNIVSNDYYGSVETRLNDQAPWQQ